jgi:hypothetical protein
MCTVCTGVAHAHWVYCMVPCRSSKYMADSWVCSDCSQLSIAARTVVDVSNFAMDYVIWHDPTIKEFIKTKGACTMVLTAVGQGTDQLVRFLAPLAVPVAGAVALMKRQFSNTLNAKQRCHQESSAATTATTAGSPASSSGAASAAHTDGRLST